MSDETQNTEVEAPEEDAVEAETPEAEAGEAEAPAAQAAQGDAGGEAGAGEADPAQQIQDLNDKLLRAMAEVENTRRIAAREKADAGKYAVTNFARDMLRVADYLTMATMAVTDEARQADQSLDNLCVGIDMTMKELLNVFEGYGIKPIKTDGQAFDHNLHEAIGQEENADVPKGTILGVQRGGFTIQDRLLRPAQVIVSTGGPKANGDDDAQEEGGEPQSGQDAQGNGGQGAYEPDATGTGKTVDQET